MEFPASHDLIASTQAAASPDSSHVTHDVALRRDDAVVLDSAQAALGDDRPAE